MDSNITASIAQKITKKDGKRLAYCMRTGRTDAPTLVFLGGYRSDMTGTKAVFLDTLCAEQGLPYLRFDYSGHGESDGDFNDLVLSDWLDDALFMIDELVRGDVILVGSSMGGWIGLLISRLRGDRIKGFIGIAAAPDFTRWIWEGMDNAARALCREQGYIGSKDGDYFTFGLLEDGERHSIFDKSLYMPFPVTLLQGKLDKSVPYTVAERLVEHITPPSAKLILIDDGDHRLARDKDLQVLAGVVMRSYSE